jgi:SAM-dependent methyltransferase
MRSDPTAFSAFEAEAWNKIPAPYQRFFGPLTARAIEPLLDASGIRAGGRLLDVATGPGDIAGRAAARGAIATGVDVAPEMVRIAARNHPAARFEVGAAEVLPFADESFDAAVCAFGVGHFAEPDRVVAELARVVSRGGRVAVAWWDEPARTPILGIFQEALANVGAAAPSHLPPGPPFFRYSAGSALSELLADAGLLPAPAQRLSFGHQLPGRQELWDGVLAGSVRTSAAILGQPPEVQRQIRTAFDALAAPYVTVDGIDLPVGIVIAAATRP